jgi:peroxiredoxin
MKAGSSGLLIVALALASSLAACDTKPGTGSVGESAPAYATLSLAGDSVSLEKLRGDVVLLNVWATWCEPCRQEIPALEKIHETYSPRGLAVVGVSVDAAGDEKEVADFAREFRMTYALWLDPDQRVNDIFRLVGVPSTFLLDREGTVVWKHLGPVDPADPQLLKAIQTALEAA